VVIDHSKLGAWRICYYKGSVTFTVWFGVDSAEKWALILDLEHYTQAVINL